MKTSAYHFRVTDGLRAGGSVFIPYNPGDHQSDFDTTAGINLLLVDSGPGVDQKTFGGMVVDATDTFTVVFAPTEIIINWHDRLRAVGDTDELVLVCNALKPIDPSAFATKDGAEALTNKTIDGDLNTVQDLDIAVLKTLAGNANKALVFDGAGAPITMAYTTSAVANALVQLGPTGVLALTQVPYTQTAAANKLVATDGTGKLPTALIPDSLLGQVSYQTDWNANTNTPAIPAASAANKGWYYVVSVAGTTNVSGVVDWNIGDWLVSDGTKWTKIDNTEPLATTTVAGLIRLATQAEVDTGTDAGTSVSPATMAIRLAAYVSGWWTTTWAGVKAAAQTLTAAWGYSFQVVAYSGTITWDVSAYPAAAITLTGNPTITATGIEDGKVYQLRLTQDGTGNRVPSLDTSVFKGGDDGLPTFSATAGKTDYATFVGKGTTEMHHMGTKTGF